MTKITEIFALTNEVIVRDATKEELEQMAKDEIERQKREKIISEAQAKRFSAIAKLEALGLDSDDLKALGLV